MTCINEMHENLGVESRESLRKDSNQPSSSSSSNQNPNNWENSTGSSSSNWEGSERKESPSSKVASSGEQERENGLKSSTPTEMFGVVDYIYST